MISDLAQEQKDYLKGILDDPSVKAARQGLAPWELSLTSGKQGGLAELAETLATTPRLLLVAPPGWGKTTLLQAILYDYAFYAHHYEEADLSTCLLCEERRLPLYLDLSQANALLALDNPLFDSIANPEPAPSESAPRQNLLVLIDHPEKGVPNLADALKSLLSSPHRLVVAARDQDAPQIRSWLSPTAEAHLLPLGEEAAFRLLLAQGGDALAQRLAQTLTTHYLWGLVQTPGLLHRLVQLASSGTLWGVSRREILEHLCRHMLGPPPSPTWTALVELARWIQAQGPSQRAQAIAFFGGPESLERLANLGLLRWEEAGLGFAQSSVQAFFLAYALEKLLSADRGLGNALNQVGEEALLFLYESSPQRQVLLRQLLASPPQDERLILAARCLIQEAGAATSSSLRRAERPARGPVPGLKGLPPGIVDPAVYLGLGRAFRQLGRLDEARLALDEGLRIASDRADLWEEMAQVQAARGHSQMALSLYQRLRATTPRRLGWPLGEAQALAQAGQSQQALTLAQEVTTRLAQELSQAHQLVAQLWEEADQGTMALEAAQAATQASPGASSFILWGRLLAQQGQIEEARAKLEQAVLMDLRSVEARLALASFLESQGELSSAIAQLKEAVALAPNSAQAQLSLGRAYRLVGAYPQARFHLGQALALASGPGYSVRPILEATSRSGQSTLADTQAEFALLEENQGQLKEALYHIRLALDLEPERAEYRFQLGWIWAGLGRVVEAEEALRQALAAQPQQAAWHDRLGHLLLRQERLKEAQDEFTAAVALEPQSPLYRLNLGISLGLAGESQPALEALEQAIRVASPAEPSSPSVVDAVIAADAHRERGRLLEGLGRTADALVEYEQATALVPHHSDYRLSQALAYGRLGQRQLMLGTLEQTARMNPSDPVAHFLLGQAYLTLGRYEEAAPCLEQACLLDPEAGDYFKTWGGLLRHLGQKEAALAALKRAVELLPRDAEAHYQLGATWEDAGELQAALAEYRAAARHQVDNPAYWTAAGRLLRRLGHRPEAMMALRTAIALHPQPGPAHAELGQALAEAGRLTEGYQALLQAASSSGSPEYWTQAARLAHQLGEEDSALQHLEEALKLDPDRAELWAERGQWLAHQERWDEARVALVRAKELAPHQQEYALYLGRLYLQQAQALEAREVLASLVNQHPQWPPARLALARALIGLGDYPGALQQCQEVLKGDQLGEAYGLMAEALAKAGRWREAIAPLEKAIALEPEELPWMDLLGRAYLHQGRPDSAEAVLRQAVLAEEPSVVNGLLGQARLAQGRYQEAAEALSQALSSTHLSAADRVAFGQALGDAQAALTQPQEAWASYEAALSLAQSVPEIVALRRRRAEHLMKRGEPKAAITELEAALPGGNQGPELHLLLAQACRQAEEWEAALTHAHHAAQAQPKAAAPQRELGIILRHSGQLGPAIKALEAALSVDPKDAAAWSELGLAYAQAGSPERAGSALEQAVNQAPEEPELRLLWGEWLLSQVRPAEALAQLQEALRQSPHGDEDLKVAGGPAWLAKAQALYARALAESGRLETAIEAMMRAIALAPEKAEYRFVLGQWQRRLGQHEAALTSLRQAVQLAPHRALWRLELGRLLWETKNWEEAAAALGPVLDSEWDAPELEGRWRADAAYILGSAILRGGQPQEALPHLTEAAKLAPQNIACLMELGRAHLAVGQPQVAAQHLEAALQEPSSEPIDPRQWEEVALLLAQAYRLTQRLDAAEWLVLKVIQTNPESAPGYAELGRLRWEQQRLAEAATALSQAARLGAQTPRQSEYLLELAEMANLAGQEEAAREALRRVEPQDAATWEQVANLHDRMRNLADALSAYRQAAALDPAPQRLVQVARLARRSGDVAAAKEAMTAALASNGGHAAWYDELGELLVEQSELEAALVSFQRAVELAPKEARFRRNLGLLWETLGQLESAQAELERVLRLDPADEVAFRHLGAVSAKLTLERWRHSQGKAPQSSAPLPAHSGHRGGPPGGRPGPPIKRT